MFVSPELYNTVNTNFVVAQLALPQTYFENLRGQVLIAPQTSLLLLHRHPLRLPFHSLLDIVLCLLLCLPQMIIMIRLVAFPLIFE